MRLADFANIRLDPQRILESRWAHDTAHALAKALRRALKKPEPEAGGKPKD